MLFRRDFSTDQFDKLKSLYLKAGDALDQLNQNYPQYVKIWDIVRQKMNIIKSTIDADEIPSDDLKRGADITTMLTYELRDFIDEKNNLTPLYKLDKAYALLGMKDIHMELNNKLK